MKKIPLSQGKFALIDDEDFEFLRQWKWHYQKKQGKNKGYAVHTKSTANKNYAIPMHRIICLAPYDMNIEIDHIDGDGLNNQKYNLRFATNAQNAQNRNVIHLGISGYKGVCKDGTRWRARIGVDSNRIILGYFATPEEAALVYNQAAKKYFGKFANLNKIK